MFEIWVFFFYVYGFRQWVFRLQELWWWNCFKLVSLSCWETLEIGISMLVLLSI